MPALLKKIFTSPTARQTTIFYIGSFFSSFLNYVFHFVLLRMITPSQYGEFSSYLSLMYLLSVPSGAISILVTQTTSRYYANQQNNHANAFFHQILQQTLITSLLIAIGIYLTTPFVSHSFTIEKSALYILALSISLTMTQAIINAYLTSLHKFITLILIGISSSLLKILLAYVLIKHGMAVVGAVLSLFVSMILGSIIAFQVIKKNILPKINLELILPLKSLTSYSLLYSLGSLSLLSTDILMVRYFFSEHDSGIYAAIMIIAKTIHFGVSPITLLIIPHISKRSAQNLPTLPFIVSFLSLAIALGSIGITIFMSFPESIIRVLAGQEYTSAVSIFFPALVGMLIYTVNMMLINYHMALNRQKINLYLMLIAIIQPLAIYVFHQNLHQIITINITLQIILLILNVSISLSTSHPRAFEKNQ